MKIVRQALFLIILFSSMGFAGEERNLESMLVKARKGDVDAMCDLGRSYFFGEETLKDPFKAKCWIKKAYDKGSKQAEKLWGDLELWRYSGKCEDVFDDVKFLKHTRGDVYTEPFSGISFIFIPWGCYWMGCHPQAKKCEKDEYPSHRVCMDGFWIGQYEITQEQWKRVMKTNPSRFSDNPDRPVENVSFDEVQDFILALNKKTKQKVSLPTEAQWEYACRSAGTTANYPFDEESVSPYENCGSCNSGVFQGETAPVGSFSPNDIGLYDMAGNVKEWCLDVYGKNAYSEHEAGNPVYKGKGVAKAVRGGSFSDNISKLRCTNRDKSIPGIKADNLGFRLILTRDN